jgi:hypothetical protein
MVTAVSRRMNLVEKAEGLDILIDAVMVCDRLGAQVGDSFVYKDPYGGFNIMYTVKKTIVIIVTQELGRGDCLFMADLSGEPEVKVFRDGPWAQRVQETYEFLVRPTMS